MRAELAGRREAEAGFTLIEVLIAMVILAVGLLALEALGIGVARAVTLADRRSVYAVTASDSLESALRQLRDGTLPTSFCDAASLPDGTRLSRAVSLQPSTATVVVQAIPTAREAYIPRDTFTISASIYVAPSSPISGTQSGTPCS